MAMQYDYMKQHSTFACKTTREGSKREREKERESERVTERERVREQAR